VSERAGADPKVRRLELADVSQARDIERRSFSTPWSEAMFVLELSKASSVCLAAELSGKLVGYLCATRYAAVWHVMNVSVAPEQRRRGVASALLAELFRLTDDGEHTHYTLEVRVSNQPAIEMYRSNGFRSAGIRPGYYSDNREDAVIMWRSTDPNFVPPGIEDEGEWAAQGSRRGQG
jgi:ribosomal-protein-alanine N-acetyltransferase